MRVKISFTVEVGPAKRRLIARHNGHDGIAAAAEVREFYRTHGTDGTMILFDLAEDRPAASTSPTTPVEGGGAS
jgi:hypothetical protein